MSTKKAFSLLEILIVLAILGLIASIASPIIKNTRDKANYEVAVLSLAEVAKSMEKHYLEKGKYPVFSDWNQLSSAESPLREYTSDVPEQDPWGRPYVIADSTENSYTLEGLSAPKREKDYPDFSYSDGLKFKQKGKKN